LEAFTSIVGLVLFLILFHSPIILFLRLRKAKYSFLLYLFFGLLFTAILFITIGWWGAISNELLLNHYGYIIDNMDSSNVHPENLEKVKSLEHSHFGIGWPAKIYMEYIHYAPYILGIYLIVFLLGTLIEKIVLRCNS